MHLHPATQVQMSLHNPLSCKTDHSWYVSQLITACAHSSKLCALTMMLSIGYIYGTWWFSKGRRPLVHAKRLFECDQLVRCLNCYCLKLWAVRPLQIKCHSLSTTSSGSWLPQHRSCCRKLAAARLKAPCWKVLNKSTIAVLYVYLVDTSVRE